MQTAECSLFSGWHSARKETEMATIPLYNQKGETIGEMPLPDSIFGVEFNGPLVHQAIVTEEGNYRQGTAQTKERGDVRGGGRKPWKQKGTGRARQGSIRSPQWRKGGTVFGPHPRSYRKDFPVKMRRGAMRSVLSLKVSEGTMIGLDALAFEAIKTKSAIELLQALGLGEAKRVLVIVPAHDATLIRSMRNIPELELRYAPNFSVRDVLIAHKVVLVKDAVEKIEAVWTPQSAKREQMKEEVAA